MRVCVIGLGYVGAVTAVCLARDGHSVLGIDLDPVKLDLLRRGQPPIIEEGLHDVTRAAADSGRLEVADRVDERIAGCDLSFVCVGTPSAPNGSQNLESPSSASPSRSARRCRTSADFHVIVVRSTVQPGHAREQSSSPLLEQASRQEVADATSACASSRSSCAKARRSRTTTIRRSRSSARATAQRRARCASSSAPAVRVRRHLDRRRRDDQVRLQRLPRGEDHLRQRDRRLCQQPSASTRTK